MEQAAIEEGQWTEKREVIGRQGVEARAEQLKRLQDWRREHVEILAT